MKGMYNPDAILTGNRTAPDLANDEVSTGDLNDLQTGRSLSEEQSPT